MKDYVKYRLPLICDYLLHILNTELWGPKYKDDSKRFWVAFSLLFYVESMSLNILKSLCMMSLPLSSPSLLSPSPLHSLLPSPLHSLPSPLHLHLSSSIFLLCSCCPTCMSHFPLSLYLSLFSVSISVSVSVSISLFNDFFYCIYAFSNKALSPPLHTRKPCTICHIS